MISRSIKDQCYLVLPTALVFIPLSEGFLLSLFLLLLVSLGGFFQLSKTLVINLVRGCHEKD